MANNNNDLESNLQKILYQYRNMPHSNTNLSPAEMMFGRNPRIRLDLLKHTVCKPKKHTANANINVKNF